jgi:inner membrane protein
LWSVGAKVYVTNLAHESMRQQNISYQKLLTIPAPFNTLLWRVLAIEDKGYYEGFYSMLDRARAIQMTFYPSDKTLLAGLSNHWPVKRLQWFTHGFYAVKRQMDDIVMTDLRMGMEPFYVFQFKVGTVENPHGRPTKIKRVAGQRRWDILRWVWHRIWSDSPRIASP